MNAIFFHLIFLVEFNSRVMTKKKKNIHIYIIAYLFFFITAIISLLFEFYFPDFYKFKIKIYNCVWPETQRININVEIL